MAPCAEFRKGALQQLCENLGGDCSEQPARHYIRGFGVDLSKTMLNRVEDRELLL
jgi:hypothetical protein